MSGSIERSGTTRVDPKRSFDKPWIGVDWHDTLVNKRLPGSLAALDYRFRPFRSQATGLQYRCTTSGVLSAKPFAQIRWPTTVAGTVTDGSAVWTAEAIASNSLRSTIASDDWPAVDGLTLGTEQNADLVYQVLVDAGISGQDYEVKHQITLADGSKMEWLIVLPVRD